MIDTRVTVDDMIGDPAGHFDNPVDVLQRKKLTTSEKRAILESWKVDEEELSIATAENLGKTDDNRLPQVIDALQKLDNQQSNA